jgi:hypothetical protein
MKTSHERSTNPEKAQSGERRPGSRSVAAAPLVVLAICSAAAGFLGGHNTAQAAPQGMPTGAPSVGPAASPSPVGETPMPIPSPSVSAGR